MRLIVSILALGLSFSAVAKNKVDYSHCQEAVNNMFQLEKISGQRLPSVFFIDESGHLQPNENYIKLSKFNEETGEYVFRTKNKTKKSFSLFSREKQSPSVKLYNYIVKKDEYGRVFSIEAQGTCESCKDKIEIAYSKKRCVPKRIYSTNGDNISTVTADIESCRSISQIQKNLFRRMKKANKCLNKLNDFYKKTAEVSDILITKIAEQPEWAENLEKGLLSQQLELMKINASSLKEKDENAVVREETEQALQNNFNDVLGSCRQYYGNSVLKDNKIFKNQSGIYEVKKENTGTRIDNPLDEINKVKEE